MSQAGRSVCTLSCGAGQIWVCQVPLWEAGSYGMEADLTERNIVYDYSHQSSAGRGETLLRLTNTLLLGSPLEVPLYFSKTGAHRYLHTWNS